jgi:Na+-driven multidrug efflux pump
MSRRAGENRSEEIGLLFFQAVRIALALAIAGILVTYFIAPVILKYSLHNEQDIAMATDFLRIRIWDCLFYISIKCAMLC